MAQKNEIQAQIEKNPEEEAKAPEEDNDTISPLEMPSGMPKARNPKLSRRMSVTTSADRLMMQQEDFTASSFVGNAGGSQLRINRRIEERYLQEVEQRRQSQRKVTFKLGDILENINSGAQVIVDDDFSLCFKRPERRPWNFNAYLFGLWLIGVALRYLIILPIRALIFVLSILVTMAQFSLWKKLFAKDAEKLKQWELWSLTLCCQMIVASWGGVVEYKGVIPKQKRNQIYVANHTTILDLFLFLQLAPFSAVGQLQSSRPSIAWIQLEFLKSLHCIWFNRSEQKDRAAAMRRIKEHISDPNTPRLIIFPEGTCVNNEYCIQFKKGSFSIGCEICPVAIKYNPSFIDAYWISRERTFPGHLMDIMTSWAMVAEVHFLEPQSKRDGETDIQFAGRVKKMIADAAGLKNVKWNGYLKHYKPSERVINAQKQVIADRLETLYQHTHGRYHQRSSSIGNMSTSSKLSPLGNGTMHGYANSTNSAGTGLRNRTKASAGGGKE